MAHQYSSACEYWAAGAHVVTLEEGCKIIGEFPMEFLLNCEGTQTIRFLKCVVRALMCLQESDPGHSRSQRRQQRDYRRWRHHSAGNLSLCILRMRQTPSASRPAREVNLPPISRHGRNIYGQLVFPGFYQPRQVSRRAVSP